LRPDQRFQAQPISCALADSEEVRAGLKREAERLPVHCDVDEIETVKALKGHLGTAFWNHDLARATKRGLSRQSR
jgi:hypothetical protein